MSPLIAVVAAIASALLFGITDVAEQRSTKRVKQRATLSPRIFADLVRQPLWLAGIAANAAGFALQVIALKFGNLALVEPLLICDLIFAVLIRAWLSRMWLTRVFLAVLASAVGVAGFLVIAGPSAGHTHVGIAVLPELAIGLAVLAGGCLALSRRNQNLGPLALALACGLCYGSAAFLVKLVTGEFGGGAAAVFTHWPVYALIVAGPGGFLLNQDAFQRARLLGPVVAIVTVADPIVSIALSLLWLGVVIRSSPGAIAGEAAMLLLMVGGIYILAEHAPSAAGPVRAFLRRARRMAGQHTGRGLLRSRPATRGATADARNPPAGLWPAQSAGGIMILQDAFTVEPWNLRETHLDLGLLAQTESVFALANGHLGWRANLDEGEPHGLPGSYLNGVYETRPLPYAESAYGLPETGQEVINVTNGKLIRLFVDDEPFDVRYGELRAHERLLDFRAGVLTRRAEWVSPTGRPVRVSSARLVSFTQRAVAAVCYEVEPLEGQARIAVQSELLANEQLPPASADPRVAPAPADPLSGEHHHAEGTAVSLVHKTKRSGLRVGAAMDHLVECPAPLRAESRASGDGGLVAAATVLRPGQTLRVIKFVAYGWSAERSLQAVRGQVQAALIAARQAGWDGLLAEQRAYLDEFWDRADVEVDGDTELQQAVRFALFHVLQAGARGERRAIPAKGLTGPGYGGHTFWDTETFVLPMLSFIDSEAAASALRWRHSTLPLALSRAAQLGLAGAAFPWRTIAGQESSGYWPAGTAAFHVNADIAVAATRYVDATGDEDFARGPGLDLLVHTARLWRSLGHHGADGRFHIDGVTGPDEYSALADDNVYTNLMARRNLLAAADAAKAYPERARDLRVSDEESAGWRDAAHAMTIPFDETLGVHSQAAGFTRHQVWDFAHTLAEQYPLMLHFPYFDLYRKQVVKQADLVLAMHLYSSAFTPEEKAANFGYYEALTVRDSSLSACTQAVIAAEVGHLGLAFDYLGEAALIDLRDLQHNTRDGLHIASLAGTWVALVSGFGGLRDADGTFSFAPRLPEGLTRLAFTVFIRGQRLRVAVTHAEAAYDLADGDPLEILHHGQLVSVSAGKPHTRPIPAAPSRPRPTQPPGREPARRQLTGNAS